MSDEVFPAGRKLSEELNALTSAPVQWWHRFRASDSEGTTFTITLGPTKWGPDDRGDDNGVPIRERTFPFPNVQLEATYLVSFTYDPELEDDEAWA